MPKHKLELTWIGKENRPKLEPRILIEDPEKSCHAGHRVSESDSFDNMLIHGDNLLALKALEQEYSGKVKCIYIDPPFNTGEAFEYYDDGIEHSLWLTLMRDRLSLLHKLLQIDGTLFIHIDDNELGYITVLLDEIFHRRNRKYLVTFKQSSVSGPKSINPGLVSTGSYILIYAKDSNSWNPNKIFVKTPRDNRYSKYIENIEQPFEKWRLITLREAFAIKNKVSTSSLKTLFPQKNDFEQAIEQFVLFEPDRVVRTARVKPEDINETCRPYLQLSKENRNIVCKGEREGKSDMYFLNGEQLIFYSAKARKVNNHWITGQAASTIWNDLLSNNLHNEGGVRFPKGKKPEALIERCFNIATNPGDLVLDSFLGSGTTAAVAHKMGRRWIGIELGDHCYTHCIPRLKKVIGGKDPGGITKAVEWKGGGGFRFYELGPSLIKEDKWGNPIINPEFNSAMLAEAMCKLEGFSYRPSDENYWMQGSSTETDYIYVTTQFLTTPMAEKISEDVGHHRSLLICCSAFNCSPNSYLNLTIKKIPKVVLKKCEWDHDDYSLEVKNLPDAPPQAEEETTKREPRKFGKESSDQMDLFGVEG